MLLRAAQTAASSGRQAARRHYHVQEPKRMVNFIVGYVGSAFHGLQIQPGVRTVEGELLLAAATLRRIKEQNYGSPAKNKLSRISRTDRGVSALANCVSFKIHVGDHFDANRVSFALADEFNSVLPPVVRVHACVHVSKHFSANTAGSFRRYEYWLSEPTMRSAGLSLSALQAALHMMVGPRSYHNFTRDAEKTKPAKLVRHVYDAYVGNAREVGRGHRVFPIVVIGQSFLYNQIRRMVGLAMAVAAGVAPPWLVPLSFQPGVTIPVPLAPPHGLVLHHTNLTPIPSQARRVLAADPSVGTTFPPPLHARDPPFVPASPCTDKDLASALPGSPAPWHSDLVAARDDPLLTVDGVSGTADPEALLCDPADPPTAGASFAVSGRLAQRVLDFERDMVLPAVGDASEFGAAGSDMLQFCTRLARRALTEKDEQALAAPRAAAEAAAQAALGESEVLRRKRQFDIAAQRWHGVIKRSLAVRLVAEFGPLRGSTCELVRRALIGQLRDGELDAGIAMEGLLDQVRQQGIAALVARGRREQALQKRAGGDQPCPSSDTANQLPSKRKHNWWKLGEVRRW